MLTAIASLTALAFSVAHAETPSPVLQSLPAEVQKHIEDVRSGCRETLKGLDEDATNISSGDDGLVQFTLSGALAVMVSDLKLCGGRCVKGFSCNTAGYNMAVYVRSGSSWKTVHEDGVRSYDDDIFWSVPLHGAEGDVPAFGAMVLRIPGDRKNCPKGQHDMLMKAYGPSAWKQLCDVIVRWNGTKFYL
jgi:hypothetical protein